MAFNITPTNTTTYNKLMESVGQYSGFACGVGLAVTTTLTVTVPSLSTIEGVVMSGRANTLPYLASSSGNTFTATCGSADSISWIAWGKANS